MWEKDIDIYEVKEIRVRPNVYFGIGAIKKIDDILKILNENLEELELEDNYQERDDYKKTKEIIEEIEQFKEQSQEDEMEM